MRDLLGEIFLSGPAFTSGEDDAARDIPFFNRLDTAETLTALAGREVKLRFGRMFRRPNLPEFRPEPEGLLALGQEMTADATEQPLSSLPAGYTYLGQFIDHDITFDGTEGIPIVHTAVEQIEQLRTPSLDLDSLYGAGSPLEEADQRGVRIYEDDGIRLRVGTTKPDFVQQLPGGFPNDLPRVGPPSDLMYKPEIADPRNDENLAVAQTHLAFIKFHNEVVKQLRRDYSGVELLRAARKTVVKHYQWIVLHDFLPRLVETAVLRRVVAEGCQHFLPDEGGIFMPFEFSGAAFRLGHSLVRESYEWNRVFQTGDRLRRADLRDLHDFSTFAGNNRPLRPLSSNDRVPSTWIIDWTRFYDFGGLPGMQTNPRLNFTMQVNTLMSPGLVIPRAALEPGISTVGAARPRSMEPIAVLDLFRGSVLGVPAAQSVLERLRDAASNGQEIRGLTPDQIAGGRQQTLRHYGLHKTTPLWYYILREAEEFNGGERLGPVGSHIVAETFVGLIKASQTSILKEEDPEWPLDLRTGSPPRFGMADLLYFVNDLNPLGNPV